MSNAVGSSQSQTRTASHTQEDQDATPFLGSAKARAKALHATTVRHANSPGRYRGNLITNQPHPATGEPEYTDADTAYLLAIDAYATKVKRRFLQASEYKSILESLGYVVMPHGYKLVEDEQSGGEAAA